MNNNILLVFVAYFALFGRGISLASAESKTLAVAVMTSDGSQIKAYSDVFEQYEALHPEITIQLDFYNDVKYKQKLTDFLEQGQYNLLYWQAGKRLDSLVEQQLLQPINSLIDNELLNQNIQPAVLAKVTSSNSVHALPFAHYPWGFYYNKALFKEHNLAPPKTWQEFIQLCHTLKLEGVSPLVQASAERWPLLSWVDYLSINVGGAALRKKIASLQPVDISKVNEVVERFSELLGNDFFFAPNHRWKWQQTMTILARKQAAMTLSGQFVESGISNEFTDKFGYFPFPTLNSKKNKVEVAPLEVWIVPQASKNKEYVAPLLAFLLDSQRNTSFALSLGWLPVNNDVMPVETLTPRILSGHQQLIQASTLVQYFDRDADQVHADNVANGIAKAMLTDDIEPLKTSLLGESYVEPANYFIDMDPTVENMHISSITGAKGTFFASNVMRKIYQKLGFDMKVTRYPDIKASLDSYRLGSDGELVRADVYVDIAPDLIQIPEPMLSTSIYLVCNSKIDCESSLPADTKVSINNTALVVQNWLNKNGLKIQRYPSAFSMLQDYKEGKIDTMLLGTSELYQNMSLISPSSYRAIIQLPVYHYVHKRHAALVPLINDALIQFKKMPEFESMKSRYWVN